MTEILHRRTKLQNTTLKRGCGGTSYSVLSNMPAPVQDFFHQQYVLKLKIALYSFDVFVPKDGPGSCAKGVQIQIAEHTSELPTTIVFWFGSPAAGGQQWPSSMYWTLLWQRFGHRLRSHGQNGWGGRELKIWDADDVGCFFYVSMLVGELLWGCWSQRMF